MGANEARHVLDMMGDLSDVIALELYTAAQALDYRIDMLGAARKLAKAEGWQGLMAKVDNPPAEGHPQRAQFETELRTLADKLAQSDAFQPGAAVRAAHDRLRQSIAFMHRDRAMQNDVASACRLVRERAYGV
jgi:histidine ammonia-lyase